MITVRYQITKTDFIQILQRLLEENIVDEVLSGKEKRNRYTITPEFVSDSKDLKNFPLSQLMVYNYGKTDSAANTLLHSKKAIDTKVAVIARACDIRAMVELEKKLQLKWDNLFLIGFQDLGYLPNKPLRKFFKEADLEADKIIHERLTSDKLILTLEDGTQKDFKLDKKLNISDNCSRCIQKAHPFADFLISTYALAEDSQDYILTPQSDRAKQLIKNLDWEDKAISENLNETYEEEAANILEACATKRENDLKDFLKNEDRFDLLTKCTACGMCVRSCPVCFCPTCNLTTQVRAKTMTKIGFLTTRFTHVGDICVECGKCSTNCPMNIPLDLVFQSLRKTFKDKRNYEAGSKRKEKVLHLDV